MGKLLSQDELAEQIGHELMSRFGHLDFWRCSLKQKKITCQNEARSLVREILIYAERVHLEGQDNG